MTETLPSEVSVQSSSSVQDSIIEALRFRKVSPYTPPPPFKVSPMLPTVLSTTSVWPTDNGLIQSLQGRLYCTLLPFLASFLCLKYFALHKLHEFQRKLYDLLE